MTANDTAQANRFRFRAWYKGDGEEFGDASAPPHMLMDVHLVYDGYNGGLSSDDDPHHVLGAMDSFGTLLDDKRFIVMQSAGLIDKNGKELFEGDIVEIEGQRATVVWWERPPEFGLKEHNEDAWCPDWNITDDSERMKIIGNIYESPDLLPKQ